MSEMRGEDGLKGTVSFGRTVSVKKYNMVRVDWSQEVDLEATSLEEAAKALQQRLDKYLFELGINVVG